MPFYEYECEKCSLRFEVRRGITESGEVRCPQCQGEVQQIFSSFSINKGFWSYYSRASERKEEPALDDVREIVEEKRLKESWE